MKTIAVIPAYNEAEHIRKVSEKVSKYVDAVIVVDDGSADRTFEEAGKSRAVVLKHIVNMGKGVAMKTGIEYAIQKKAGRIVLIDADGQHDPREIPKMLKLLSNSDIVLGARKMPKNAPLILRAGNWGLDKIFTILFGAKIDDTQNGFRAFNSKIYKKIKWKSQDYFVETEMIINLLKHNLKYEEVLVRTYYHDSYKGTTVLNGIHFFIKMIEVKLKCN